MLSSSTFILSDGGLTEGKVCEPFNSQDLISNSPYCLLHNSYDVSLENLLLNRLIILLIINIYLHSSHFFARQCIVIVRRNSFLVTHS